MHFKYGPRSIGANEPELQPAAAAEIAAEQLEKTTMRPLIRLLPSQQVMRGLLLAPSAGVAIPESLLHTVATMAIPWCLAALGCASVEIVSSNARLPEDIKPWRDLNIEAQDGEITVLIRIVERSPSPRKGSKEAPSFSQTERIQEIALVQPYAGTGTAFPPDKTTSKRR